MSKLIVYIAEATVSQESGMGRVAWYWKNELEKRGYEFLHIGPAQLGSIPHPALFPYAARHTYQKLGRQASAFLVHEPASGAFVKLKAPTIVVSHGLERREWILRLQGKSGTPKPQLRTRLLFPLWRLRQCDLGLRQASLLLLINQQDADFAQKYYHRELKHIYVFRNGVTVPEFSEQSLSVQSLTILFLGSWIERKGVTTLIKAAQALSTKGLRFNWMLAGTGFNRETVLNDWPEDLRPLARVIPSFSRTTESELFYSSQLFILPSFFEGQPLALLQAMALGQCCITTNCCGQRDLIQHNYNGLLFEPGDFNHLAALIQQCAEDGELRATLGKNAQLSVSDRSWDLVSAEVVDQVEKVLNQESGSKC